MLHVLAFFLKPSSGISIKSTGDIRFLYTETLLVKKDRDFNLTVFFNNVLFRLVKTEVKVNIVKVY
jgi:hypothetical protein